MVEITHDPNWLRTHAATPKVMTYSEIRSRMCCHVKEMISSFFIFIYTQTMLFKQGDVAAKVGKKTELYVSGGTLDEGHHIFSGEPFENNLSISSCLINRCRLPGNAC